LAPGDVRLGERSLEDLNQTINGDDTSSVDPDRATDAERFGSLAPVSPVTSNGLSVLVNRVPVALLDSSAGIVKEKVTPDLADHR